MSWGKRAGLAGVVTAVALWGVFLSVLLRRPAFPEEWKRVKPGMSIKEIQRVIPQKIHRACGTGTEGLYLAGRDYNLCGIRECCWLMILGCDENGVVEDVRVWFYDRDWGPLAPFCDTYRTFRWGTERSIAGPG